MTFGKTAKWMSTLSLTLLLAACGGNDTVKETGAEQSGSGDAASGEIHVITREAGSGTRDAFTEIVDVVDENGDDAITQSATVQNGTNAVIQSVSGDVNSIGYISLGSLNDSVKAVKVDGVEATPENITAGEYAVARNFNVTYGKALSEVAQDFWDFMFSAQAQELVAEEGYVSVASNAPKYEGKAMSGDITIVGSTSVQPIMERFADAYGEYNPDVKIDITAPGSGAGVTAAIDGTADIGMSSRKLDEEETAQVSEVAAIAVDGIAVIVNNDNPVEDLSLKNISGIYLGEMTTWDAAQ